MPIDILKIDRSLIEQVHAEPQRQEVLLAIGHIAEKLGLGVIVEGVELEAQRTTLLELGFRHRRASCSRGRCRSARSSSRSRFAAPPDRAKPLNIDRLLDRVQRLLATDSDASAESG